VNYGFSYSIGFSELAQVEKVILLKIVYAFERFIQKRLKMLTEQKKKITSFAHVSVVSELLLKVTEAIHFVLLKIELNGGVFIVR
jgi:hypothetical protein